MAGHSSPFEQPLTDRQLAVLRELASPVFESDGSEMSVADLAVATGFAARTVQQSASALVRRGLADRIERARRIFYRATERGHELVRQQTPD